MIECRCGEPLFPHMKRCPQCGQRNGTFSSRTTRLTVAAIVGVALMAGCFLIPQENADAGRHLSYLVIGVIAYLIRNDLRG